MDVQQLLMMRGTHSGGRAASVFRLVRRGWEIALIPDRKGVYLSGLALGEQSCVRARVDSAGKEDTDWNVGHLPQPNRRAELGHKPLDKLILRNACERSRVIPDVPISMFLDAPVRADP